MRRGIYATTSVNAIKKGSALQIAAAGAACYDAGMSSDPFHLNRPVHLARRDVFYEKAVERIHAISAQKSPIEQRKTAEQALYLLQEARRHAEVANLSEKTSVQSRLFVSFMDSVIDNALSISRMLGRQTAAGEPENSLDRFLGSSGAGANMSNHYRRCTAHVLKGLLHILQQAEKPFRDVRQTSLVKMTPADKARYEKACRHFEERVDGEAETTPEFPGQ